MSAAVSGGMVLGEVIRASGAERVFGVPGTQNVGLIEGLRSAGVPFVTATSELAASFMANGHARVTRRAALLATIPGPGFCFALAGVAEARLDHVPLVWICVAPERSPDGRPTLQALPQEEVGGPLVKAVLHLTPRDDVRERLAEAVAIAETGEPGPVLLHVEAGFLDARVGHPPAEGEALLSGPPPLRAPIPSGKALDEAFRRLAEARRPLLYVGQGGLDAVEALRETARLLSAPVVTTTSARGVLPEDDPAVLVADRPGHPPGVLNELLDRADLVVALGCAFSHNGSHGFRLRIPPERFLHVNAREGAPPAPYQDGQWLRADVRSFLDMVLRRRHEVAVRGEADGAAPTDWDEGELAEWKARLAPDPGAAGDEPVPQGNGGGSAKGIFAGLRDALPRDGILVTDSGRHQVLARRHFCVTAPGGLMAPSNLQAMGFAVPAAIGAALAAPGRRVVALLGDGGLQLSAMELLRARRYGTAVCAVVFRDGELALIADQQRNRVGRVHATDVLNPDVRLLAGALGLRYLALREEGPEAFSRALEAGAPVLVDVPIRRSAASRVGQARSYARESVGRALGAGGRQWLRGLLGGNG